MGPITARPRKDGSTEYTARVQIKKAGKVVFSRAQTFDRPAAASIWIVTKKELAAGEGCPAARGLTVGQAIDQDIKQSRNEMGKTKAQVLGAVKNYGIADLDCADLRPADIVDFATEPTLAGALDSSPRPPSGKGDRPATS